MIIIRKQNKCMEFASSIIIRFRFTAYKIELKKALPRAKAVATLYKVGNILTSTPGRRYTSQTKNVYKL